jgi:pimeloyl-ACP methyl ester carboxylesterase
LTHGAKAPQPLRWRARRWAMRARGTSETFSVPSVHFWCDTEDDVRLAGTILNEDHSLPAVVFAHGFAGYRTKPKIKLLAEALARRYSVFVFDLRGHGQSTGACSGGELEMFDVHAVVQAARRRGFERVVSVGGSLGGIAVLCEAARFHDVDAVVAISSPAVWLMGEPSRAVRRATWLFTSRAGRALSHRVLGTRIGASFADRDEAPVDLVSRISPIPLLVVHGENDHFFPVEHAKMLFGAALEPKRLMVIPDFGHAEDGFTGEFASRLSGEIADLLALSAV